MMDRHKEVDTIAPQVSRNAPDYATPGEKMSKSSTGLSTDTIAAVKTTEKALKKINKLARKSKLRAVERMEADGLALTYLLADVDRRYLADYNERLPLSLFLKLAMDAADAGTLQLPGVEEATAWWREECARAKAQAAKSREPLAKGRSILDELMGRATASEPERHVSTVNLEDLDKGIDMEGNVVPEKVMAMIRKKLAEMAAEKPASEPETKTDPSGPPEDGGTVRFTNPFETNHEKE